MQVRPVLLLIFTGQIVAATQPETEQVSLSAVYSFLTDDLVARRFYVQIIAQFIFISTGWLVSHEIWRLFNPETDTEVNVESLVNFLVTDQNSLGGASIGIGYGVTSAILWVLLSQLANPISVSERETRNEDLTLPVTEDKVFDGAAGKDTISVTEVLAGLLTRNGVLIQIVINAVLSAAFLTFWMVMDILP